jgi:hypothetical protein
MFVCMSDRIQRDIEEWRKLPENPIQAYVTIAARESTAVHITWKSQKHREYERNGTRVVEGSEKLSSIVTGAKANR